MGCNHLYFGHETVIKLVIKNGIAKAQFLPRLPQQKSETTPAPPATKQNSCPPTPNKMKSPPLPTKLT